MKCTSQPWPLPTQSLCLIQGWIAVRSIEPISCGVSKTFYFLCIEIGKSTCRAQNAIFRTEHANLLFHHRLSPIKSIDVIRGWSAMESFVAKCQEMTRTRCFHAQNWPRTANTAKCRFSRQIECNYSSIVVNYPSNRLLHPRSGLE